MIVLETDRLLFRSHCIEDLDAYCAMMADPEFRHMCGGLPLSRAEAEVSLGNVIREQPTHTLGLGMWATELKSESLYIGRCGIYPCREDGVVNPKVGVLAYYIARPFWGRGLASEAAAAFVAHGFGPLSRDRLVAGVSINNIASNRILQKLGFEQLRTAENHIDYELKKIRPF